MPVLGFAASPISVRVARGEDVSTLLVFSYSNQRALEADWEVGAGTPAPRPGKNPGAYQAVWWNQNAMVLLRTRGFVSAGEAREAFLALGPEVSPVGPPVGTGSPAAAGSTPRPGVTAGAITATSTPARAPTERPTAFPTLAPPR